MVTSTIRLILYILGSAMLLSCQQEMNSICDVWAGMGQ